MNKLLPISVFIISISFVALLGYGIYYMTVTRPLQQKNLVLYQIQADQRRRDNINYCLQLAEQDYSYWWNQNCIKLGRGVDCLLPNQQADNLHQALVSRRISCENIYR